MVCEPSASDVEQVLLDPNVFSAARHFLKFKPSADMFASSTHHQLPRYYSKDPADFNSAGLDAFRFNWKAEAAPYFNPPWSRISEVLQKIRRDEVRGMIVLPVWPSAEWWPLFESMRERFQIAGTPVFLTDSGDVRPLPRWKTIFAIINGARGSRHFAATTTSPRQSPAKRRRGGYGGTRGGRRPVLREVWHP
jgi:hypothetical protein